MFKRILLATDFSPHAAAARDVARRLAQLNHASITVVTVLEPIEEPLDWTEEPAGVPAWKWERMLQKQQMRLKRQKREKLDKWVADLRQAGLTVNEVVREGDPDKEIVAVANDIQADLIVMGSHSRQTFLDVVLGHVTTKVIQEAPCPVLVVGHRPPHPKTFPQRILWATDFSHYAEAALQVALSLAQEGGTLWMVSVLSPHESVEKEHEFQTRLNAQMAAARSRGIDGGVLIRRGDAIKEICKVAVDVEADIIVLGSHGSSTLKEKLLGSVPVGVTRCAPCPVLVVSGQEKHIKELATRKDASHD